MLYPLSYSAHSELRCTPLHSIELYDTPLRYTATCWATPSPIPYRAMLFPFELRCTFWAMLTLCEPRPTGHLTELHCTHYAALRPIEPRCTLDELAHPNWATLHPSELRCTLLSSAELYWATLNPTELLCTLLSYAVPYELRSTMWATHYSLTELPTMLVPLCNFVKCRNAGLSGTLNKATPVTNIFDHGPG